jgi:hypothetical protein
VGTLANNNWFVYASFQQVTRQSVSSGSAITVTFEAICADYDRLGFCARYGGRVNELRLCGTLGAAITPPTVIVTIENVMFGMPLRPGETQIFLQHKRWQQKICSFLFTNERM